MRVFVILASSRNLCSGQCFFLPTYHHYYRSQINTALHKSCTRDNTQFYLAVSYLNCLDRRRRLEECLLELQAWVCVNELVLNPDKTDAIIFGTHRRLQTLDSINFMIHQRRWSSGTTFKSSEAFRCRTRLQTYFQQPRQGNEQEFIYCTFCHIQHALKEDTAKTVA